MSENVFSSPCFLTRKSRSRIRHCPRAGVGLSSEFLGTLFLSTVNSVLFSPSAPVQTGATRTGTPATAISRARIDFRFTHLGCGTPQERGIPSINSNDKEWAR